MSTQLLSKLCVRGRVTMPDDDMFWGDRYGKLEDPFGHEWAVATQIRYVNGRIAEGCRGNVCIAEKL